MNYYNITGTMPHGMNINEWITEKMFVRLMWNLVSNKKPAKRVIFGKRDTYGKTVLNW